MSIFGPIAVALSAPPHEDIWKQLMPLAAALFAAILAFAFGLWRYRLDKEKEQKTSIQVAYRSGIINLSRILTIKNDTLRTFDNSFTTFSDFVCEFANPHKGNTLESLKDSWKNWGYLEFIRFHEGPDKTGGFLKEFWEMPKFLKQDIDKLTFTAKDRPIILDLILFLEATQELLTNQLKHREVLAKEIQKYFRDQHENEASGESNMESGHPDFIIALGRMCISIDGIKEITDRCIVLSFALAVFLEHEYLVLYKKMDFYPMILSPHLLSLVPETNQYRNYFGMPNDRRLIHLEEKFYRTKALPESIVRSQTLVMMKSLYKRSLVRTKNLRKKKTVERRVSKRFS